MQSIEERASMFGLSHTKHIAYSIRPQAMSRMHDLYKEVATEQRAIDHSEEHLKWIIKQHHDWSYKMCHCDNNECCTFKEWIDKAKEE